MKKYAFLFIFLVVPGAAYAMESLLSVDVASVESRQEQKFTELGRYEQEKISSSQQTWVYQTPQGDWGYQVIIDDGLNVSSIGYGPEAEARTYAVQKEQKSDQKLNAESLE